MRLIDVTTRPNGDATRLTGTIQREGPQEQFEVYFEYRAPHEKLVGSGADALAAALLLPAMRAGESLNIVPPISARLSFSLPRIRDIFHTWWPHLPRIEIYSRNSAAHAGPPPDGAATFFSGGVDSFYSLLKHRKGGGTLPVPLSHLIFMKGIETRLELSRGIQETESWVRDVATEVGVECIVGESNVRTSLQGTEENLDWERHYHGSALAAVALGLSGGLAYVCIPSAFTYNYLIAHGSTPLVDEMYSTEHLNVVHDGAESSRANKLASILEWDRDLVLQHLRVCIWNSGGAYNCGKCYKCVRTAIPLYILGLWDRARTFPNKATDDWERVAA